MKRAIMLLLAAALCLLPVSAAGAVLSEQKLTVDGVPAECEKYNVDGENYFKLRDLAQLMNGTGSRFSVSWDGEAGVVSIVSGETYIPVGGELEVGADKSETAAPSTQTVMVNGEVRTDLRAYNIGGNNYFRLRDLGEAVGFRVDYDAETRTVLVRSFGEAGETGFSVPVKETVIFRDAGTFYRSETEYVPGPSGTILRETHSDSLGAGWTVEYTYDGNGDLLRACRTDADGTVTVAEGPFPGREETQTAELPNAADDPDCRWESGCDEAGNRTWMRCTLYEDGAEACTVEWRLEYVCLPDEASFQNYRRSLTAADLWPEA